MIFQSEIMEYIRNIEERDESSEYSNELEYVQSIMNRDELNKLPKYLNEVLEFRRSKREENKLNILLKYSHKNDKLSLKKVDETMFKLIIDTDASFHYCTNECKGKCRCTDKEWRHDCWEGTLITHEDIDVLTNIYNFLKENINKISTLNRADLYFWFKSHDTTFMSKYYSKLYEEIESYFNSKKELFTDDFYESFKDKYTNKYKGSEDEDTIWKISSLSTKYNFKNSTFIDKYETYQNYRYIDEDNIFNNNLDEMFGKTLYIYYIYQSICDNLESTLY